MSLTPIFDQLLSEKPLSFRECSDKIFPWPTSNERFLEKIALAKRNHPSIYQFATAPRPINHALDSLLLGVKIDEEHIERLRNEPLSGRIVNEDESWLKPKPFIAPFGTRFFLGYDPAGEEVYAAKVGEDGRIININPA